MVKYLLLFLLIPIKTITVEVADYCSVNPTYCQILKNQPDIDRVYANKLARYINQAAERQNLRPFKLTAILAQESKYKLNAINLVSKDYGIAQINERTIQAFGFDKNRLLTDLEYSVNAGAIVLADFKRMYGHREEYWWSRYNSSNKNKRKIYVALVERYM